jgi:hypothetical protein
MRSLVALLVLCFALAVPAAARAYSYVHEVLPGERLRDIAKRYHTTKKAIRRRNRLRRGKLRAGRKLRITTSVPSRVRRRIRYMVRKGDSLSKIAKKHKLKTWVLRRLNHRRLRKRRTLREGMRLWVVVDGPKPSGGVKGLYQLSHGPGYRIRDPKRAWGTFIAISRIHEVLGAYSRRFRRAKPIKIWDLSRKGGGYFPPHKSHRSGRDVDIPYPLRRKYSKRYRSATPKRIHPARAWWLIKRFIKTGDVTFIFIDYPLQRVLYNYAKRIGEPKRLLEKAFQYPRGKRKLRGIMRDEPGHSSHFHVRFRADKKKKKNKGKKRSRKKRVARRG